ncbi:MAG: hypothetical protein Q8Q08_07940 [Candidatus Omnitrophota bacterium]|nr:hypothetical protein [Candidatus Omnitrophota bacterium]MDZ4243100.1 hypothetical protein [Candidatus Omnitrophota bacterium]
MNKFLAVIVIICALALAGRSLQQKFRQPDVLPAASPSERPLPLPADDQAQQLLEKRRRAAEQQRQLQRQRLESYSDTRAFENN